ncbi:MAG: endonuclease MutS2 [Anaerovoracaceae bacterium]|jgi:DNA mismatch repair protein MutS2
MNQKAINVLEYRKIIKSLEEQAGSEMTRKLISELQPYNDVRIIRELLAETDEAVRLSLFKGPLPIGSFYDIGNSINYAGKGGVLTMQQLLHIAYNMRMAAGVASFLKGDLPPLPIINSMVELLALYPDLEGDIDRCIEGEDQMSDDASPELRDIRSSIVRQNESIKNRISRIISSRENAEILQDSLVTVRDGRYVIPVKAEHKARVPGIIHDQSSSGATLFIEPQVIVEMNNKLRELAVEEQAEIDRILTELSERVAEHYDGLKNNQELMVQLDLINAKGKLALAQEAECPNINEEGILHLKDARHPLIDRKKVVPIDVKIGEDYSSLIITGPNTGGKTVTLKTCGLLCMMAQTGLHIPASGASTLPVYRDIYADIVDEQSIEQSLSTFSSHMNNIVDIVAEAGEGTLVLIDELGAGTDPTEGAALAIAILEKLAGLGATVMATTHYNELKKYALSTEGVENASMEFDVETLSPTYHLTIGTPGRSNAFEISRKLGLDDSMIERARDLIEGADLQFEDVLAAIEDDKKAAEAERDEAVAQRQEMERQRDEMKAQMKKAEQQREQLIRDAKEKARGIIAEAREVSRDVQEELRELAKIESLGERNKRFSDTRKKIKDAAGRYREEFIREVNDRPVDISKVKLGDRVKILSLGQNGEVIGLPDEKGEIQVQAGALKMRRPASDLKLILEGSQKRLKRKQKSGKSAYGSVYKAKAQNVKPQIDVRGQNLDEAADNVAKYLDDVYISGMPEVTIIHGRGEGILSKGLRQQLKKNKHVAEFRKGGYNEGGDGVTVVKMKDR